MPRPYRPSGKSEPVALFKLLIASVVAALAVGAIEGVVSHLGFNLLILFPLAIGFAAGAVGVKLIRSGKIRAPGQAALIVGLAAVAGQGMTHYAGYVMWRGEVREQVAGNIAQALAAEEVAEEERAQIAALDPDAEVDLFLTEETGRAGFVGYMALASKAGVAIGRAGSGDESRPTLTGVGTYVLWAVEAAMALLVGFVMAYGAAKQPFCELCKQWYGRTEVVAVGSGAKANIKAVTQAIEVGDFGQAMSAETLGEPGIASLVMTLDRCTSCEEHEPLLSLKRVVESRGKAQTKDAYRTMIRPDQAREIEKILERLAAERPAEPAEEFADAAEAEAEPAAEKRDPNWG